MTDMEPQRQAVAVKYNLGGAARLLVEALPVAQVMNGVTHSDVNGQLVYVNYARQEFLKYR